jgi:hypothetical protein
MSRMGMLITAFWIFVIGMLIWEFNSYNQHATEEAIAHPAQTHFFYYNTNVAPLTPPPPRIPDGPYVKQITTSVERNQPSQGNFIYLVTLKNVGNAKAVGVQVLVRPFAGADTSNEDGGDSSAVHHPGGAATAPTNYNPMADYGAWITFPDLAPGQSDTESTVFLEHAGSDPGGNPAPQILFKSEKDK